MLIGKNVTWNEKNGIKYIKYNNLEVPGIYAQGTTTRVKGASLPPFESLNLGYFVNDKDKSVADNRRLMRSSLGLENTKMITADQIHSNKVTVIQDRTINGGWDDPRRGVRMSDALITNIPNLTLVISTADCVPILIFDPIKRVIAAVHAGWKGTGLMITERTIRQMMHTYNTRPEDCIVSLGPSIGICCYTVDIKVIDFFRSGFSYWRDVFNLEASDLGKLNLGDANKRQLMEIGVLEKNIQSCDICTSCNNDSFFSFRKENGNTGRQMTFITLAPK